MCFFHDKLVHDESHPIAQFNSECLIKKKKKFFRQFVMLIKNIDVKDIILLEANAGAFVCK